MATKKAKASGSTKMNASRKKAPQSLAQRLKGLGTGVLRNDIIINGSPQPDSISGSVTVKNASSAGNFLSRLLSIPGAQFKPVQLFPKGQPPAIDQIVIKVNAKIK